MFGSNIVEFALGMIFFYFLLSALCSTIQELIAGILDWRTQELVKGVRDLLNLPMATGNPDLPAGEAGAKETLGDRLFAHALIKGLTTKAHWLRTPFLSERTHQPSYIPASTFSLALVDILVNARSLPVATGSLTTQAPVPADTPDQPAPLVEANDPQPLTVLRRSVEELPSDLQQAFRPLIGNAANDLADARRNIEDWFNAKMDRISGAYKRWTLLVLVILGLALSVAFNADSIALGQALWQSPTLRQTVALQVDQYVKNVGEPASPNTDASASDQIRLIEMYAQNAMVLPIGWGSACGGNTASAAPVASGAPAGAGSTLAAQPPAPPDAPNCTPQPTDIAGWGRKLAGWLLTTLAISFGAPFWFDLLKKVSNLRSSGPSPNDSSSASATSPVAAG